MIEIENKPFKRHALAYDAIQELLIASTEPLTITKIQEIPAIAELRLETTTVYDILKSFHKKRQIRKVPYHGAGNSKWAWEWIRFDNSNTIESISPKQFSIFKDKDVTEPYIDDGSHAIAPPAEEPAVPEILVTATSVVIKTSKIKITVEY